MSRDVHLILLIHGLWGNPAHLSVAEEELEAAYHGSLSNVDISGPASDPIVTSKLKNASAHDELVIMVAGGMTAQLTYDGIDVCGSRVAWELDQKVKELEEEGKNVVKFSLTGYSLGGLVARYLVGLLHSRQPSFFDEHKPISFATLASPHYGIPKYNTLLSTVLCRLGARILSRSGEQLYVVDRYSNEDPRPLLEIMASPRSVFFQGLERFERLSLFAAAINDNSVPYPTGAIETIDHFAQWSERGISVDSDEAGIIKAWHEDESEAKSKSSGKRSWGDRIGTLPPVLKYRFPFNYVILLLFPIMLPLIVLLILARQSFDTTRSKLRLQQLAQTSNSKEYEAAPSGLSIQTLRDLIRRIEHGIEADLVENADESSLPIVPMENAEVEGTGKELHAVTLKVELKDSQVRMALWLNRLRWNKYLTWWPEITNAHATAIVRDRHLHPVHERGRGMLKLWAKVMLGLESTPTS